MNIVISSKRYLPMLGGTIQYAVMMASGFQQMGHKVILFTRTDADPEKPDNETAWPVLRNPDFATKWKLAGWADVILQVDASWKDVYPFLLRGVPWFPTIHNGKTEESQPLRIRLANLFLWIAFQLGRTIPVGSFVGKQWGVRSPPIRNPYQDKWFHPPVIGQNRDVDLLFVGRIERSKGVFLLIDALKQIAPRLGFIPRLVVVGGGKDLEELRREAEALTGKVSIEFAGQLDAKKVADRMRQSKTLVFPTTPQWIEASPLTVLEAQACGCRVIAADSGGTRENLSDECILIPSGRLEPLAAALELVLNSQHPVLSSVTENWLENRRLQTVCNLYLERFNQDFKNGES